MPIIPPTLNGLRCISVELTIPWRGAWFAECELDVLSVEAVATILATETPVVLIVGGRSLIGTIDVRESGVFGNRATATVVASRGGWENEAPAQHFAGVAISTAVYAATAAIVLEPPPLDPSPISFGTHYTRSKGPASRVFGDRDWFVQLETGIVVVSEWPPLPMNPEWVIADFDAADRRLMINADTVISPGTIFADPRFGTTTYVARDVVQTFDATGSHAEVWCSDRPVSRLQESLAGLVREFAQTHHLKTYKYRYVLGAANQMALQAITPGAPDIMPIEQWSGMSGITAMLAPATEIVVGFSGADPSQPHIVSFSNQGIPISISINASGGVTIGVPTSPVALSTGVQSQIAILQTEVAAIAAALVAVTAIPPLLPAHQTAAAAATTAVGVAAAALATAAPTAISTKLLSQ